MYNEVTVNIFEGAGYYRVTYYLTHDDQRANYLGEKRASLAI